MVRPGRVRCPTCRLHPEACLCGAARRIDLPYRIHVYQHSVEVHRQTNTARLIPMAVEGSRLFVLGRDPDERELGDLLDDPSARVHLVFPDPGGASLDELRGAGTTGTPLTFLFLDGSWRQARKMRRNLGRAHALRCVRLDPLEPSRYRLRKQSRPDRLCTAEAAAELMRAMDPAGDAHHHLRGLLDLHIRRQLRLQGILDPEERSPTLVPRPS